MESLEQLQQQNNTSWVPQTPIKPIYTRDFFSRADACNSDLFPFDLNLSISMEAGNSSSYSPATATAKTMSTMDGGDTPAWWLESLDCKGLSFLELTNVATPIGLNHSQSQSRIPHSIPEIRCPANGASAIGDVGFQSQSKTQASASVSFHQEPLWGTKENDELPVSQPKNKKKKVSLDSNKQTGEKRQNKYYWAKIDLPKVRTPKPKTPKAKTPKPIKKKVGVNKNIIGSTILEVVPERKDDLSCKRVLNFGDSNIVEFEDEGVKISEKEAVDVGKQFSKQTSLRVYRRSLNFKCVKECRRIGSNFASGKKRRVMRKKKPIGKLKQSENFNNSFILQDLLDLAVMVNGDVRTLLPRKVGTNREPFKCLLSLLSSPMRLKKKKRSAKRWTPGNVFKQSFNSPPIREFSLNPGSENDMHHMAEKCLMHDDGDEMHKKRKQCDIEDAHTYEGCSQSASTPNSCSTKKSKTKVAKEQTTKRIYKRKEKRKDYLAGLDDWHDESLNHIMDSFVQEFASLQLYDDASKLEPWSIMISGEDETTFNIEKSILYTKALRFLDIMRLFQGRKNFVEWKGSVLDSVVGVFLTQNVSDVLSSTAYMEVASRYPLKLPKEQDCGNLTSCDEEGIVSSQGSTEGPIIKFPDEEESDEEEEITGIELEKGEGELEKEAAEEYDNALKAMLASLPPIEGNGKKGKKSDVKENEVDWEAIRRHFVGKSSCERNPDQHDSVDWEAVRKAPVEHIANAIICRGQHRIIAGKIQKTLNRLVDEHGTMDLEWLRKAPPQVGKAYLLSFYGLGLKSVECLRLLTLKDHGGFPVDVNIGRIVVRLGWVPLQPLPDGMPFHVLQKYPLENEIQKYLLPRLSDLTQEQRYELHYQMITFGKVFCMKKNPNCKACPFKAECKYYKSRVDSLKEKHPLLSWSSSGKMVISKAKGKKKKNIRNPFDIKKPCSKPLLLEASTPTPDPSLLEWARARRMLHCHPRKDTNLQGYVVEHPASPKKEEEPDIEDLFKNDEDDADEYNIDLTQKFNSNQVPHFDDDVSKALVSLPSTSLPLPKHINPVRLRTEHQVYELPSHHQLLKNLDKQEGDVPYLLAIWPRGKDKKTVDTLKGCSDHSEEACCSDNVSNDCSTVRGTLLIPVRTAMRGAFPLNGTYFQVNEVFADDETSEHPINVPRECLWELKKRTLYCGSGTSSIFRGLTELEIVHCCWRGFICTRGFNRQTRAPKPLPFRFHNRANVKGKQDEED